MKIKDIEFHIHQEVEVRGSPKDYNDIFNIIARWVSHNFREKTQRQKAHSEDDFADYKVIEETEK